MYRHDIMYKLQVYETFHIMLRSPNIQILLCTFLSQSVDFMCTICIKYPMQQSSMSYDLDFLLTCRL